MALETASVPVARRLVAHVARAVASGVFDLGSAARVAWLRAQHPDLDVGDELLIERGLNAKLHPSASVALRNCELRRGVVLRAGPGAELSIDGSMLGPNSVVAASESITIGRGCAIAEMAVIRDQDHVMDPPRSLEESGLTSAAIRIGDHVWIGAKATVLKGVEIGDHAVVAANAVVTRSVPSGAVVAGIPARRVR